MIDVERGDRRSTVLLAMFSVGVLGLPLGDVAAQTADIPPIESPQALTAQPLAALPGNRPKDVPGLPGGGDIAPWLGHGSSGAGAEALYDESKYGARQKQHLDNRSRLGQAERRYRVGRRGSKWTPEDSRNVGKLRQGMETERQAANRAGNIAKGAKAMGNASTVVGAGATLYQFEHARRRGDLPGMIQHGGAAAAQAATCGLALAAGTGAAGCAEAAGKTQIVISAGEIGVGMALDAYQDWTQDRMVEALTSPAAIEAKRQKLRDRQFAAQQRIEDARRAMGCGNRASCEPGTETTQPDAFDAGDGSAVDWARFTDTLMDVSQAYLEREAAAAEPSPSAAPVACQPYNTHDGCHPGHDEEAHPGGCHDPPPC